MPILSNPRWERFAQELANGVPAPKAYVTAGYKGAVSRQRAHIYKQNPKFHKGSLNY